MEDRNGAGIMAIGGLVTVVILGMWVMKFIQEMFIQLGKTFDAFAAMVTSVIGSLWALTQVVLLGSLILGSVAAAIYFTYRYVLMVKRGTAIQENVTSQLHDFSYALDDKLQKFQSKVESRLTSMSHTLQEALKEPEAAPAAAEPNKEQGLLPPREGLNSKTRDITESSNPATSNKGETETDLSAVSNPY